MQKFTLQSSDPNRKNTKVVLLHSGETSFNDSGEAVVEVENESQLKDILASYSDLTQVGGKQEQPENTIAPNPEEKEIPEATNFFGNTPIAPQTESQELGKSQDEKNDIGGGSTDEDDDESTGEDELSKSLDEMNVESLKSLAKESGFPAEEWENLTKKPLKAYLKKKLEQADANN